MQPLPDCVWPVVHVTIVGATQPPRPSATPVGHAAPAGRFMQPLPVGVCPVVQVTAPDVAPPNVGVARVAAGAMTVVVPAAAAEPVATIG